MLDTGITKIINEMQVVVEKIIAEYSGSIPYFKSYLPNIKDDSMIPTRDDDYCKDLKNGNNMKENVPILSTIYYLYILITVFVLFIF